MSNNSTSKLSWRIWLIKKLLKDYKNKEDILKIISEHSDLDKKNDYEDFDDNNENKLINNIINLGEKSVEDVMVPRAEIKAIKKNQNIKTILSIIETESHSRMPVFEHNLDNILGFVHIKDVLKNVNEKNFNIKNILREVLYVAPKSPILDLLKRMRLSRIHMGLVVDEFGGVDGLVTIEDLVEEIVGEIEDEHDQDIGPGLVKQGSDVIDVDAHLRIEDFELEAGSFLSLSDREEDIDTVGGLVFYLAGRVPGRGEVIRHSSGIEFEVIDADPRRIRRLRATSLPRTLT